MRSLKARFCLSFALPFVLGLFFFFFFFYVSSLFFLLLFLLTLLHFVFFFLQSFLLDPTSLVLSSLVLQRLQIYPGPEGGSLALGASASDRAEAKQPWPPRYLPSGINQLNARLLEASPSLKPILLAFLRLPILFPPADVFEGRPLSGRDLPIINSTRLSTPRTHTGHPPGGSFSGPAPFDDARLARETLTTVRFRLQHRVISESNALPARLAGIPR